MNFAEIVAYLEETFGVSLDGTMPTLQKLAHQITVYNIIECIVAIAISIVFIVVAAVYFTKLAKGYKSNEPNWFFDEWNDLSIGATIASATLGLACVLSLVGLVYGIGSLAQWIFIPEARLIEYISGLIG